MIQVQQWISDACVSMQVADESTLQVTKFAILPSPK